MGEHGQADGTYRQGLDWCRRRMQLRNNLALSLALQEKFPEAVDLLRPLAEGPESTRRTRQNLALVYGLQGDLAAAERLGRVDLGGPTCEQSDLLRGRAGHGGADGPRRRLGARA